MDRPINRDLKKLAVRSSPATVMDLKTASDLEDTLRANSERCVGMAANMIGIPKNIIVFDDNGSIRTMFNPQIVSSSDEYEATEGCLSLPGQRKTKRFYKITVRFQDRNFRWNEEHFEDWTAQIIQHEIDHLSGILI